MPDRVVQEHRKTDAAKELIGAISDLSRESQTSIRALQDQANDMQAKNGVKYDHIAHMLGCQGNKIDELLSRTATVEQQTKSLRGSVADLYLKHNNLAMQVTVGDALHEYQDSNRPASTSVNRAVTQSGFMELDGVAQKIILVGALLLILGVLKWVGLTPASILPTEDLIEIIAPLPYTP